MTDQTIPFPGGENGSAAADCLPDLARRWSRALEHGRGIPIHAADVDIDSVTDLYSAFDPDYQHAATAALTAIIDAIIERCPAAFSAPSPDPENPTDTRPSHAFNESE